MSIVIDTLSYTATSIIYTYFKSTEKQIKLDGTGFFYHILGQPVNDGPFSPIEETYLITNRHLFFAALEDDEIFTHKLVFGLKLMSNDKVTTVWDYIELSKNDLIARTKVEKNPEIDVAAIRVGDLIMQKYLQKPPKNYVAFSSVTNTHFPKHENGKFFVEVGDDVIIIGYPYGYYDSVNLYPIVKSGMISTSLYKNFEGQPCFLIDARLFRGSSGSLVISKPQMFRISNGEIKYAKVKQFDFLGVFSGELYKKHEGKTYTLNVGKVWKWYVSDFIIKNGVSFEV